MNELVIIFFYRVRLSSRLDGLFLRQFQFQCRLFFVTVASGYIIHGYISSSLLYWPFSAIFGRDRIFTS